MKKFLFFRTDRIGDYLVSAVLINAIKRNNPTALIEVVASSKNYEYIKSFDNIDKVRLLKNNIIDKIKYFLIYFLSSYDVIIIHDSKKRSFFISLPILHRLKIKFDKNIYSSHKNFIMQTLNKLNYNFKEEDLNTLKNRIKLPPKKKYCIFHFDEKWLKNKYIDDYCEIEPSENELKSFLDSLLEKIDYDIIVTTGVITPKILKNISENLNKKILIKDNMNYLELENIILCSSLLISCHGFASHVASSSNIKQIDIIDKNSEKNYKKVTDHFRNYNFLYRKKFADLSYDILNKV